MSQIREPVKILLNNRRGVAKLPLRRMNTESGDTSLISLNPAVSFPVSPSANCARSFSQFVPDAHNQPMDGPFSLRAANPSINLKIGMATRFLFDERIANTETRESSKVTVNCPQFTDPVFHNKCGDMGIMRQVS